MLYDATGKELDRNRDTNRRDPLIDFTVPADGVYYVEVHDFLYAGSNEYFYRLVDRHRRLSRLSCFRPPVCPARMVHTRCTAAICRADSRRKLLAADGKPLESLAVQIALPADQSVQNLGHRLDHRARRVGHRRHRLSPDNAAGSDQLACWSALPRRRSSWSKSRTTSRPRPRPSRVPCEFVGQFYPQTDRDWVTIQAKAGEALWIEVFSQRLGLPTDPYLLVQQVTKNDKGEEQVKDIQGVDDYLDNPPPRSGIYFDMKTDDPALRFVAPADGTYRILVRNLSNYSRPDPRFVYRLAIHPAKPDFRLVVKPRLLPFSPDPNQNPPTVWSPLLRKGGTELIDVMVFRRDGFDGEVQVTVDGLPAGVTALAGDDRRRPERRERWCCRRPKMRPSR